MKKYKHLKLSIAAFLALGFIGVAHATEIVQESKLRDAVRESIEKAKDIIKDSDSVAVKETKLKELPQQIGNAPVARSSESTRDALEKQFKGAIDQKVDELKKNPKAAKEIAKKIKVPTKKEVEDQFKLLESKDQSGNPIPAELHQDRGITPSEDQAIRELFRKYMNQ